LDFGDLNASYNTALAVPMVAAMDRFSAAWSSCFGQIDRLMIGAHLFIVIRSPKLWAMKG
jgi:hypothetical protein